MHLAAASRATLPVPTRALLCFAAAWCVLALLASILIGAGITDDWLAQVWWGAGALVLLLMIVDWLSAMSLLRQANAPLGFARDVPHTVPVGVQMKVGIRLTNHSNRALTIHLYDAHPDNCVPHSLPIVTKIPAGRFGQYQYTLTPQARGDLHFGHAALRLQSPLGLWLLPLSLAAPATIRSFPNYAAVTRYALLAVDHRLSQVGVLRRRRRGEGMDFHQLRDYRDGDSPRSIDWKATARRVKLISREYQDERDQQVLFLLDCSRRMNAKDVGVNQLSHFDHTLNAILLMTFVAIRQGDAAGLLTFGGIDSCFIAPAKSQATMGRFLNALYPLEPTLKTPDYQQAALELSKRLNKRALIVVISNVRDEDEDGLAAAMAQLKRRHLVLFANLKEAALEALADFSVDTPSANSDDNLVTLAAATQYMHERQAVLARMRAQGINLLDVVPEKLAISLVNRYLDMKQSGAF